MIGVLAGGIIAAVGWAFLLFGVGVDSRGFGQVANLHAVAVAQSAILTGGFVSVVSAALMLLDELRKHADRVRSRDEESDYRAFRARNP